MTTTQLFVEHVLSGIQAALVAVLMLLCVFGLPSDLPVVPDGWILPLGLAALAVIYPLGVVWDEVADLALTFFERGLKRKQFVAAGLEPELKVYDLLADDRSDYVRTYLRSVRMRIRILRTAALSSFLICVACVGQWSFRLGVWHPPENVVGLVVVSSAVFTVASLLIWRAQTAMFYMRAARAYARLLPPASERWSKSSKACSLALDLHANQSRKGTQVPYLTHLFAVTAIVLEYCDDDAVAAAAMLHDAAEDQGGLPILKRISEQVDTEVGRLVQQCSDDLSLDKSQWQQRKQAVLDRIESADANACLIKAADLLHNMSSCAQQYRLHGNELWRRFRGGQQGTMWFYKQLLGKLSNRIDVGLKRRLDEQYTILSQLVVEGGVSQS